jgi:hypothetical protein
MLYLALPRYRPGDKNGESTGLTDRYGSVTLSGVAQQDYILSVKKTGFYRT